MADGSVKIDTRLDNSKIKGDLKELERLVSDGASGVTTEFAQKVEKLSASWSKLEAQQSKNNAKISEFKGRMEELQRYMDIDMKAGNPIEKEQLREFSLLTQKLKEAEANAQGLSAAMSKVGIDASNLKKRTEETVPSTKELANKAAKVNQEMSKAPKSVESLNKGLQKGIKTLMKYAMALVGVRAIYGGIQKATNAWMQSTKEGAQAQSDLQYIWASLGQTIAPVIQWLIKQLQTLLGYANAITKAFFGFELFSKSVNKNLSKSTKQAKELRKQLAGFDEMNILSKNGQQNLAGNSGVVKPTEIGTPDISGFKNAIDQIKKWLDDLWNSDIVQSYWDSILTITGNRIEMIKSITLNMWDNVRLSFDEMFPYLEIGFANMVELWRRVLEDMALSSSEWFPIITDSVNSFVDSVFNVFRPFTTLLAQIWADMSEIMLNTWNKYGKDILDNAMIFINKLVETMDLIVKYVIDPVVRPALDEMKRLWDVILKDIVADVADFVFDLTLQFLQLWNNAIWPFIQKMIKFFGPIIGGIFTVLVNTIGGALESVLVWFRESIAALKKMLSGLIEFLEGIFTKNWEKAWNGLGKILEGVFEGLVAFVKMPLNIIIGLVNGFIRGLNKLKIPDWIPGIGGNGINIPEIPKLARGGITTGATTAIIGEAGREAVIPLQNNTDWIHDFLALANENGGLGNNDQPLINIIQLDGDEISRKIANKDEEQAFRNGGLKYGY